MDQDQQSESASLTEGSTTDDVVKPFRNSVGESMKLKDALNFLEALKENNAIKVEKLYKSSSFVFGRDRSPALVIAAAICRKEVVQILIEKGEDVNCFDGKNRTPALVAAASGNDEVLELLLNRGAKISYKFVCPTSKEPSQEQWKKEDDIIGIDLPVPQRSSRTLLHEAVVHRHPRCVKLLLSRKEEYDLISKQDDQGNTALHLAVNSLPKQEMDVAIEIVELLIGTGTPLCIKNKLGQSALNAFLKNKELKPIKLLLRTFDKQIKFRDDDDRKLRLEFQPICSNVEKPYQVLNEFLETKCLDREDRRELFKHPLLRAFVRRKWLSLHKLFYISFMLYVFHVISLTIFVTLAHCDVFFILGVGLNVNTAKNALLYSGIVLISTSILVTLYVISLAYVLKSCYRWKLEMWINAFSCILSFIVVFCTMNDEKVFFNNSDHGSNPSKNLTINTNRNDTELLNSTLMHNQSSDGVVYARYLGWETAEWVIHVTTFSVFLSWLEVMFLVGRFPRWASQALLLQSVLKNVLQAMITYGCMIAGFSMVFFMLFSKEDPNTFGDPLRSLSKTFVMMTGEFEYGELFKTEIQNGESSTTALPLISRIWFIFFIIIASIALMNLMVGLAVSDTQELAKKCFESQVMKLAHSSIFWGYFIEALPVKVHYVLKLLHIIPQKEEGSKIVYDLVETVFPDELENCLSQIAKRNLNQRSRSNLVSFSEDGDEGIPANVAKKLNRCMKTINEIHELLLDLSANVDV